MTQHSTQHITSPSHLLCFQLVLQVHLLFVQLVLLCLELIKLRAEDGQKANTTSTRQKSNTTQKAV